MKQWFHEQIAVPRKKAMPVLSFPSVGLLGISVSELIGSSERQAQGMKCIADAVDSAASLSMMDLSVEAEAFGSVIRFSENEVPTVTGSIIADLEETEALKIPQVGAGRTGRYVEAIGKAVRLITDRPVFAGVIGPYSLAGRLMDISEALANCLAEPDMVHAAMRKTSAFLIAYITAYKQTGANGVVIADPLTGLLSDKLASEFSTPYVRQIVEAVQSNEFAVVYHNCGNNTIQMIGSLLRTGCTAYHFGDSIDMAEMMRHIPADVAALGNVSPAREFRGGTPESIYNETLRIMEACCPAHPNFIISSGCDIPPLSSWDNINAFFRAVKDYYER